MKKTFDEKLFNQKNIIVTGGYGFIGSNFINYFINNFSNVKILNVDKLGIGSNINNINTFNKPSGVIVDSVHEDISRIAPDDHDIKVDYIFHFAAESHVDRSISTPEPFIQSNIVGTFKILELVKKFKCKLIYVSTDEVTGSIDDMEYKSKETDLLKPNSVYSASKAAGELLVRSYVKTYGIDAVITRCTNNFGPNQYKEKLIPKVIHSICNNLNIVIYDKGQQIREWTYVDDHIEDLIFVSIYGKAGEIYNVGQGTAMSNIDLIRKIIDLSGYTVDESKFQYVPNARPGHDFRYSITTKKLKRLKKENSFVNHGHHSFEINLKNTIEFYKQYFLDHD